MYPGSRGHGVRPNPSAPFTRLLFVDDEPSVRRAFVRSVSSQGFLVDAAATAREGLELFQRGKHPLVVTDLSMPGGSGVELLRSILTISPLSVFVVVTGVRAPNLPTDPAIRDRIVSVVAKPWNEATLASTLQRALRSWKARAARSQEPARESKVRSLLLVEDDDLDHELFMARIETGPRWRVARATNMQEAVSALERQAYDVVVSDLMLPDACGVDAVLRIKAAAHGAPLVVLSNVEDDATSTEAVKAGAHDFLLKDKVDGETLLRSLSYSTERAERELGLRKLANEDPLTGLANRARFQERLAEEVARSQRAGTTFGLLYLDLDGFKGVNDQLGHDAGDALLIEVGRRLTTTLRETDFAARLGGDEFAVVIDADSVQSAATCAQRILVALARRYGQHQAQAAVTASVGVALYEAGESPRALTKAADAAMYQAKARGRNRCQVAPLRGSAGNGSLAAELNHAIEARALTLHYQVQVDREGNPQGLEALLRWRRVGGRLSPPAEFLPLLEASGDIENVGANAIRQATMQLARWRSEGYRGRVAVNVSACQLGGSALIEAVRAALAASSIPPECLELELTESAVMQAPRQTREVMCTLKQVGVRWALDDFGSGASSFSSLHRLPFDTLKIDRCLTSSLFTRESSAAITRAILTLRKELDLQIVAEGVETDEQRRYLIAQGCDLLQGFLFARPEPAECVRLAPTSARVPRQRLHRTSLSERPERGQRSVAGA